MIECPVCFQNSFGVVGCRSEYLESSLHCVFIRLRKCKKCGYFQKTCEQIDDVQSFQEITPGNRENLRQDIAKAFLSQLRKVLSNKKNKYLPVLRYLGCTPDEFKTHIESQFIEGMSWENYGRGHGKWALDHIIPVCSVDVFDREQLKKVMHFSNIRPLWSVENSRKSKQDLKSKYREQPISSGHE